jgi:predicted lipoprotein with Yx(FWY)xxD motif
MRRLLMPESPRPPVRLALLAAAAAALIAMSAALAGAKTTKLVAKEVESASLGKTVVANLRGHTLYSLSAEKNGRFICTASCLATWHPLLVPAGVKPTGPVKLGTIKRPEGKTQVTFKGRPLYRFGGDSKPGEANGEGIMDVGIWHAATIAKTAAPPSPEPKPEPGYPY